VCFIGICQKGKPKSCNDNDPCTIDTCTNPAGCKHTPAKDGHVCAPGKTCSGGQCVGGVGVGVNSITLGGNSTCAISKLNKLLCWGIDSDGQVGNGESSIKTFSTPQPVKVTGAVTSVSCGGQHCCAVVAGKVWCWGDNAYGQVAPGTAKFKRYDAPVAVGVSAESVAVGEFHSCALDKQGSVKCWGLASAGQVGAGDVGTKVGPTTTKLSGAAKAITAGRTYACALLTTGAVQCWGYNGYGQLGNGKGGTSASEKLPSAVLNVANVTAIAAGREHTCALIKGGVWCWGRGGSYQLGESSGSYRHTPKQVPGLSGITAIATGSTHTCAVDASGGLWCWGGNAKGQANDKAGYTVKKATKYTGLSAAVENVAGGLAHTCVITKKAELWCWGSNASGQVGNNTKKDTKVAVHVQ